MAEPAPSSLGAHAEAAFRQAAAKVVLRARQTGTPVIVWEDGAIRYLSPDEAQERIRNSRDKVGETVE